MPRNAMAHKTSVIARSLQEKVVTVNWRLLPTSRRLKEGESIHKEYSSSRLELIHVIQAIEYSD
jgi:hypothetical protein